MSRAMLFLVFASTSALAATEGLEPAADARAKAVEADAFAAVEAERWCPALDLFLEANGIVANADLVFNAAQAAEYAGDRARAVALYTELLGHAPTAARKAAAKKKIKALTTLVEKDGAGPSCPPPAPKVVAPVAAPVIAAPVIVAPVAAAPVVTAPSIPATPPVEPELTGPVVVEELAPEHPIEPPVAESVDIGWPWVTAGAGGGVAVLGIAGLAVGGYQYLAWGAAKSDLANNDDRGSVAFADANFRRKTYAANWNNWGSTLAIASSVVLGAGVAVAAAGGAAVVLDLE